MEDADRSPSRSAGGAGHTLPCARRRTFKTTPTSCLSALSHGMLCNCVARTLITTSLRVLAWVDWFRET